MWNTIFINPIFNFLVLLYKLTGNLGVSIIIFTITIKALLIPITLPSLKMAKKQRDVQPELEKINQKFKYDKQKQAQLQMELFRKHGINPAAGCVTTIVTLILMLAIYRVVYIITPINATGNDFINSLNERIYFDSIKIPEGASLNTRFLSMDISKPVTYLRDQNNQESGSVFQPLAMVIIILSVVAQFISTRMVSPYSKTADKAVKKTPGQADDMVQAMQKQNQFVMPLMLLVFGLKLPAGVMLYILFSNIFQIFQTYVFSGLGGLKPWINKLKSGKKVK